MTLLGCQTPRIGSIPPWVTSLGQDAVEMAALAGMPLDPWQQYVQMNAMGRRADGRWAAPEVGLIVPRQNGKSACVEISALTALYLMGSKIVYTSHLMATSRRMRERIQLLVESTPDLAREIKQIRVSNEEQSIKLKSGAQIDFVARTGGSARGWSAYDIIFLDEAFAVLAAHISALMPILFTRPNWQLWYISMAGKPDSHVLHSVRRRGIQGDPGLAYFEWSVPEDVYREAPEYLANMPAAWAQANPALGYRITEETIASAQRLMSDPEDFAREVLDVWGSTQGAPLLDRGMWARLTDVDSRIAGDTVFAIEVVPGLTAAAIVVAGYREDGTPHVEVTSSAGVLDHRGGIAWVAARAAELHATHRPSAWVVDPAGPAGALLEDLRAVGIEPELLTVRETAHACGALFAAVMEPGDGGFRHVGQPALTDAAVVVQGRSVGDGGMAFWRQGSGEDITTVLAAALALHGLAVYGNAQYEVLDSVY